ncbi:MAG: hypothetical protein NTX27_02760 [Verrucomicrobia bacterium]|nr:hypothetical protein [Verrucomicrobiota bacterium]
MSPPYQHVRAIQAVGIKALCWVGKRRRDDFPSGEWLQAACHGVIDVVRVNLLRPLIDIGGALGPDDHSTPVTGGGLEKTGSESHGGGGCETEFNQATA